MSGGFLNEPTSYEYEWFRDDELIAGAESVTYTTAGGDLG